MHPQEFEATLPDWMAEHRALLAFEHPRLGAEADPERESPLDALKAGVCANLSLFLELNEEEFAAYLPPFAQGVWELLVGVSDRPGQVRV